MFETVFKATNDRLDWHRNPSKEIKRGLHAFYDLGFSFFFSFLFF